MFVYVCWQWIPETLLGTAAGMLFPRLFVDDEYFYVLELVRVGVILVALRDETLTLRERIIRTLKLWLPYLGVFILSVLFRLFVFNNQVYGMGLTSQLKSAPIETLQKLAKSILLSLRLVLKDAWLQMVTLPDVQIFKA
jgi:hypothetical protein